MRGARVPKFVVTKSSRSESHLALGLQNLRAFGKLQGARAPVPHAWRHHCFVPSKCQTLRCLTLVLDTGLLGNTATSHYGRHWSVYEYFTFIIEKLSL